jgi:hypothetical protein
MPNTVRLPGIRERQASSGAAGRQRSELARRTAGGGQSNERLPSNQSPCKKRDFANPLQH